MSLEFVLVGTGAILRYCAGEVNRRGHTLRAVFTDDPATAAAVAAESNVPVGTIDALQAEGAVPACDVLLSVGNVTKLPPHALAAARRAAVNYHDGPLPRYPGLNAPSWALINGEADHGMTWHLMTAAVDGGGILEQRRFRVDADDTSFTLGARCYEAAIDSLPVMLDRIERGDLPVRAEPLDEATRHLGRDRPPMFSLLDWSKTASELVNLGRALDFGPYANALGVPKVLVGDTVFAVRKVEPAQLDAPAAAGRVCGIDQDTWTVACAGGAVAVSGFMSLDGTPMSGTVAAAETRTAVGRGLPIPTRAQCEAWDALSRRVAPHERFWTERLRTARGSQMPPGTGTPAARQAPVRRALPDAGSLPAGAGGDTRRAWLTALAAVAVGREPFIDLAYRDGEITAVAEGPMWVSPYVPLRVPGDASATFAALWAALGDEIASVREHGTYPRDLPLRLPAAVRPARTAAPSWNLIAVDRCDTLAQHVPNPGAWLTLVLTRDDGVFWEFGAPVSADVDRVEAACVRVLAAARHDWNAALATAAAPEAPSQPALITSDECIHTTIERTARQHPGRAAVHARDGALTYAELDCRANRLARYLTRRGVRREDRVAICVDRSLDLVVAVLGVLKAGACYVPVDPTYPRERTAFMVRDSQAALVLANAATRGAVPQTDAPVVWLDRDARVIAQEESSSPDIAVGAESLAYQIYTSGSTGTPKGVMLEHRQVGSFFTSMDPYLGAEAGGTWLAVTSLSFDISVLELLWTLSRGFTVVVGEGIGQAPVSRRRRSDAAVQFSLFYFSGDASGMADGYRLLLEGARFADAHGFVAVWTPERHFHAFGGLYPNPAVTASAVAAVTEHVDVRAGSVVMPLHHPIRVAEEWAVVDNVSGGRVGISFAAGWQPNDFVLRPENFADNKTRMLDGIEEVRALWRGEPRVFQGPGGRPVEVRTLPRPVQAELPTWLTAAGNPETFRIAGERGFGLLTHLLGQSITELGAKIAIYRDAWAAAGHAGRGHVTLMLHTFVADDEEVAKETVRAPLKEYLRTSVNLIKDFGASFPALKKRPDGREPDFKSLSAEDMNALLDYSFERYYESSGLMGTPEKCRGIVQRLAELGVDEVACLIDFGVDTSTALAALERLDAVRAAFASGGSAEPAFDGSSVASLVRQFGVTHMQCTPSLARILLADDDTKQALGTLRRMLVGGEALPVPLGRELSSLVGGRVLNMYGPTETTIWSTVHEVTGHETEAMPIGRPLGNTVAFVVDEAGAVAPPGVAGELLIGGAGVARGYHARPELTSERFIEDRLSGRPGARLYRTGDRAQVAADGSLEFLGRMDHQIKIRGHRVELGEIEALLARHAAVAECAVTANTTPDGDVVIVGHVVPRPGGFDAQDGREFLKQSLPAIMVPSRFAVLDSLPHTPNGKVDRVALTKRAVSPRVPETPAPAAAAVPASTLEEPIAEIWRDVLGLETVGADDNFFELGGHSLSAVHVHTRLKTLTAKPLAITDLFRFPTIRALAGFLGEDVVQQGASSGQARAQARKQALARRRTVHN